MVKKLCNFSEYPVKCCVFTIEPVLFGMFQIRRLFVRLLRQEIKEPPDAKNVSLLRGIEAKV
jgi:hypothetical protein